MSSKSKKNRSYETSHLLGATRYIMALAVLAIFLGSTALLISGTFDMLVGIWDQLTQFPSSSNDELRIILIEAVDSILISTVLYVIAAGLYQLFIDSTLNVPDWMQTRDVSELEQRLSGMVVTILGVVFLTRAMDGNGSQELLWLGLSIASVVLAISLFLYQEKKE